MELICPFTYQPIDSEKIEKSPPYLDEEAYYYPVVINGKEEWLGICKHLFKKLVEKDTYYFGKQILVEFNKVKTRLFFEYLNPNSSIVRGNVFHWNCKKALNNPTHTVIKPLIKRLYEIKECPVSKEQYQIRLLKYIFENQKEDKIKLIDDPILWGQLFCQNFTELLFFVEELADEDSLQFDKENMEVILLQNGLDRILSKPELKMIFFATYLTIC